MVKVDSLEEEGVGILTRQGVAGEEMKLIRGAEMRYFGQLHDVKNRRIRKGEELQQRQAVPRRRRWKHRRQDDRPVV